MSKFYDILDSLKKYAGRIELDGVALKIIVDRKKLTPPAIGLLYDLLNRFQDERFIVIEGLPYCLMPDALEHMVESKKKPTHIHKDLVCASCDFADTCLGYADLLHFDKKYIRPLKEYPSEIVLEVTSSCNLNCTTCTLDRNKKPLSLWFNAAKRVIDEAASLGIKMIRFTGGEPFLNKDIQKMLIYAKVKGFYIQLNTNATLIDDVIFPVLAKTVDNVLVSLQGYDGMTNSRLTNSGIDFKKKTRNILRLKSCVPVVRAGTVISKTLIRDFAGYVNLLNKLGVRYWDLFRPVSGKTDPEFDISKRDILTLMKLLHGSNKRGLSAKISNPVPFCITKKIDLSLSVLLGSNFDDGHSRMVYDARRYYKPSYFIDIKLGRDIVGSWKNPFLKKLRSLSYLPQKCRRCVFLKWCKGGSRAVSKLYYNDYFRLDPLCCQ